VRTVIAKCFTVHPDVSFYDIMHSMIQCTESLFPEKVKIPSSTSKNHQSFEAWLCVKCGEEAVIIDSALELFVGVPSDAFWTSSGRTTWLGELRLHYRLLRMNRFVEELGSQLSAVVNFYLLQYAPSLSLQSAAAAALSSETRIDNFMLSEVTISIYIYQTAMCPLEIKSFCFNYKPFVQSRDQAAVRQLQAVAPCKLSRAFVL